VSAAG